MTGQTNRLPTGGLIDRGRTIRFSFDGRSYAGHPGDTLASALLANGEPMVARSFKYHRPRGILGAGSEDPAALVEIVGEGGVRDPNTRATEQEIYDGLVARAQNCWPSLRHDLNAVNDLLAPFLPAGFYYKTFKGPPASWMFFEPFIRRAAGLGHAPEGADPDGYESVNRHCDVLVIGGGAAGLSAALAAGRAGARVILAEETAALGGRLLGIDPAAVAIDGKAPAEWIAGVRAALGEMAEVSVLTRTAAIGYYGQNFVALCEAVTDHLPPAKRPLRLPRQRLWRVRAKEVVLATGALERPIAFHGNDRPGIMLAGAVATYIHRYGVLPGRRVAVLANNDSGWHAAFDIAAAGAAVVAIVDVRSEIAPPFLAEAARRGIPIHASATVTGTEGRRRIRSISVAPLAGSGGAVRIGCDLLAVAGGYAPSVALFSQSRG
ncbi:2Fe-2S iron-sulfur cluster-binding protein, partial [Propylenella binzhouense]|nr:FAD-dependent oxidoreductase [Propylenella binzhouense]